MRFLADENIFPKIISHLRKSGHDVKGIKESGLMQATDDTVVEIATEEERSLLDDIFCALENLFQNYRSDSFKGRLIVLSRSGYRIR